MFTHATYIPPGTCQARALAFVFRKEVIFRLIRNAQPTENTLTTKQHFSIYEYKLNGTILNIVSQHPYLGIMLDHKLSWHPHIETLPKSLSYTGIP